MREKAKEKRESVAIYRATVRFVQLRPRLSVAGGTVTSALAGLLDIPHAATITDYQVMSTIRFLGVKLGRR
jgi:hypothetical protein